MFTWRFSSPWSTARRTYRRGRNRHGSFIEFLEERTLLSSVIVAPQPDAIRSGFDAQTLRPSDDGAAGPVPIGFAQPIDFLGRSFTSLYVNNNGSVSFGNPFSSYDTADANTDLQSVTTPMIAPFFADVDTRAPGSGTVSYGVGTVDGHAAFAATWLNVGYYGEHFDKTDSFQMVLIDRSDIGEGDFDIELNYNQVQWDSADSAGGSDGVGGVGAVAAFTNGSGQPGTSAFLAGSDVGGSFLDSNSAKGLIHNSLNSSVLGRYELTIRNDTATAPPVVGADTYSTTPGQTLQVTSTQGLLTNDASADGSPLHVAQVNGQNLTPNSPETFPTAQGGQVTVSADGSFSYVPAAGFHGADSFVYAAGDTKGTFYDGVVTLDVNTPPVAPNYAYSTLPGQPLSVPAATGVLSQATDADHDPLTVSQVQDENEVGETIPTNQGGFVTLNSDGSFSYTPPSEQGGPILAAAIGGPAGGFTPFHGNDSFTYTVQDPFGGYSTATVTIAVDTPPVASDDTVTAAAGLSTSADSESGVLVNASDAEDDNLTVVAVNGMNAVGQPITTGAGGQLTLNADGSYTYLAPQHHLGADSIPYTISDGFTGGTSTATLTFNIVAGSVARLEIDAASQATAGAPTTVSVIARDQFGNIATTYTGPLSLTSDDPHASFPATLNLVSGQASFQATFTAAGLDHINFDDDAQPSLDTAVAVQVAAGSVDHLDVAETGSATAGTQFTVTVEARDLYGNLTNIGVQPIQIHVDDTQASVPTTLTLVGGTGSFRATLITAGTTHLSFTNPTAHPITASTTYAVTAAPANHLDVTVPDHVTAGTPFTATVEARDRYGNLDTNFDDAIQLNTDDPNAILETAKQLVNGLGSFQVTLETAAADHLNFVDTAQSSIGAQLVVNVAVAPVNHFVITAPTSVAAGSSFTVTLAASDPYGNLITNYSGPLTVTTNDGQASIPTSISFTNGRGVLAATLRTAGTENISLSDSAFPAVDTTLAFSVAPLGVDHLVIHAPTTAVAGSPFNVTVEARDKFGNFATSYTGPINLGIDDTLGSIPSSLTLVNGQGQFGVDLKTAGTDHITLTNPGAANLDTTLNVAVAAAPVDHLAISAPQNAVAGSAFNVTIVAYDVYGNVANSFTDPIGITTDDEKGSVPTTVTPVNGQAQFGATFETAGTEHITLTDPLDPAFDATLTFAVAAASVKSLEISAPTQSTAGSSFGISVIARDEYGNIAVGDTGPINISSDDAKALGLPTTLNLTNGQGSFNVTLKTAATDHITFTNPSDHDLDSTLAIAVAPAAANHLDISTPTNVGAGSGFQVNVVARDPYGNIDTSYAGPLQLGSDDSQAILPSTLTLVNGTGSFQVTLETSGTQHVSLTDAAHPGLSTTLAFAVSPAAADHLTMSAASTDTAGNGVHVVLEAFDHYGNLATGYTGPLTIGVDDGLATAPTTVSFSGGNASFTAVLRTAGTVHISLTDAAHPILNTSLTVAVSPAPANHLVINAPSTATAGSGFNVTFEARDPYGNLDTNFADTLTIGNNDSAGDVPTSVSFSGGLASFAATLKTAGNQTLTFNDPTTGLHASAAIAVSAAAADHLQFIGPSSSVDEDASFGVAVTALDPYGNLAAGYRGTVKFSSTDPNAPLPLTYTFGPSDGGTHTFSLIQQTPGTQTLNVVDLANSTLTQNLNVTVGNVAPKNVNLRLSSNTIAEGSLLTLTGSFADPGKFETHTVVLNWGDGGTTTLTLAAGVLSFSTTHTYTENPPSGVASHTATISAAVSDGFGGLGNGSASVQVDNVAPTVHVGGDRVTDTDSTLIVAGYFTDPGQEGWHASVNYGAGSVPLTLNPDKTFTLEHQFTAEGTYTVTTTVVDADGGTDSESFRVFVTLPGIEATNVVTTSGAGTVTDSVDGVTAVLQHTGTGNATVLVGRFHAEDASTGVVISPKYDVRVVDANESDSITIVFHYTGSGTPVLYYNDPVLGKVLALGSHGSQPVVDPIAQTITIILDSTSTPMLSSLVGTVFTVAVTTPLAVAAPNLSGSSATVSAVPNFNITNLTNGLLTAAVTSAVFGVTLNGLADGDVDGETDSAVARGEQAPPPRFVLLLSSVTLSPSQADPLETIGEAAPVTIPAGQGPRGLAPSDLPEPEDIEASPEEDGLSDGLDAALDDGLSDDYLSFLAMRDEFFQTTDGPEDEVLVRGEWDDVDLAGDVDPVTGLAAVPLAAWVGRELLNARSTSRAKQPGRDDEGDVDV